MRDLIGILQRRKTVILLITVGVMAAGFLVTRLQSRVYSATAEIVVEDLGNNTLLDARTGERRDPIRKVQTEIGVLRSAPVRAAVREAIGSAPSFSAKPVEESDLIRVTAKDKDPKKAAAIVNAYSNSYLEFRRKQDVDDAQAATKAAQAKIADLQGQIGRMSGQDRELLVQQQVLLKQRLAELQVDSALNSGSVRLVPAAPPTSPAGPTPLQTSALSLALGLILGTGVALLIEHLDDSINTKEDLARAVTETPVLGLVPRDVGWKDGSDTRLAVRDEPSSAVAEACRTLRTSIQVIGLSSHVRSLQITSPNAGEGKTSLVANLGAALAQAGDRVTIIGCDLRRPRIHEFLGVSNSIGLTSVLLGDTPLEAALAPVPGIDNLFFLPSGPAVPNPSELLSSPPFSEILDRLESEASLILIDSPPVLPVSDALVLSSRAGRTLLLCQSGKTTGKDAARAAELLLQVDAHLIGTVLNAVPPREGYGAYTYQYAAPATVDSVPRPVRRGLHSRSSNGGADGRTSGGTLRRAKLDSGSPTQVQPLSSGEGRHEAT